MSFLAPLYLLGALAVSLPVVLHMIRRTPRDRRAFSSIMFLQPSPPRITRRSRIEHWLLLLLRGLAVCLLALAFARPFLRQSEQQAADSQLARGFVVLLDTSASMQRDTFWTEATADLQQFLHEEPSPADLVAVLTFDDQPRTLCSFEQWASREPSQRANGVATSLAGMTPGWRATNLGSALVEAAEQLDALALQTSLQKQTVVVISDLQAGSDLSGLQMYDWPDSVQVDLRTVGELSTPNNAGLQVAGDSTVRSAGDEGLVRLHVTNSRGADRDEFTIHWRSEAVVEQDESPSVPRDLSGVTVIVPAGQSRIVRAAPRPDGRDRSQLQLDGDEHPFDNVCFVPPPRPRTARVAVLAPETDVTPTRMAFYLPAALSSLPGRQITLVDWRDHDRQTSPPQLVIVTTSLTIDHQAALRTFANRGGSILLAAASAEDVSGVYSLLDVPPADIEESATEDYTMLTDIDFTHPLFAALQDPRFSDFTKVRFWRHRVVQADTLPNARLLASFDNGDAAILEMPMGNGRLILMTAGWQPEDSQLAVSSKFVPMLNGLVDEVAGIVERRTTYHIGEPVALAEFDLTATEVEAIRTPDGDLVPLDADATHFVQTLTPGLYTIQRRDAATDDDPAPKFAVNLAPAESRTWRLTDETLVAAGAKLLHEQTTQRADGAAGRQLRARELENRQKMWRWLIVAVLVLLVLETWLAARAARRQLTSA